MDVVERGTLEARGDPGNPGRIFYVTSPIEVRGFYEDVGSDWAPRFQTPRADLQLAASGVLAEPYPRGCITAKAAATSGTLYLTLVGLRAGDSPSGIAAYLYDAGTDVTLLKVGIWNNLTRGGTFLAYSDDQTSSIHNTPSPQRFVWAGGSGGSPLAEDGPYYVGLLTVAGTGPQIGFQTVQAGATDGDDLGDALHGQITGLTDLPADILAIATTTKAVWLAPFV